MTETRYKWGKFLRSLIHLETLHYTREVLVFRIVNEQVRHVHQEAVRSLR